MVDNHYFISTDKSILDVKEIKKLLAQTYWAENRSEATIRKSLETSICYGLYDKEQLIGFGRVVTDYATVYWVCDIIIDKAYRGQNLGKRLMREITTNKDLQGLLGILVTRDAHGLYKQYGFHEEPNIFMMRKRTET